MDRLNPLNQGESEASNLQVESRLGHTFIQKDLLLEALTHRSFANESSAPCRNNERLEFLGDAVIDLVASDLLMRRLADASEGTLSQARAQVVSEGALTKVAEFLDVGAALRLGKGEDQSGGRRKASLLADAVEALIGALYLDAGYSATRDVVSRLFAPLVEHAAQGLPSDAKTRLQEWSQAKWSQIPRYAVVAEQGPDHAKVFEVTVAVDGREVGRGKGRSKKEAEQVAAEMGLNALCRKEAP